MLKRFDVNLHFRRSLSQRYQNRFYISTFKFEACEIGPTRSIIIRFAPRSSRPRRASRCPSAHEASTVISSRSASRRRFGPSTLLVAVVGVSRWAGSRPVSNSILYHEGGPQVLHTFPSTTWYHLGQRERSTSSRWRERGGAHCRPRVRDTRVCRAPTASSSPLSNGPAPS